MKNSGFNFFNNLLVFTANQTWQLVIKNVKHETLCCWSSRFDIIVQKVRLLSKWLVKVERAVFSMHVINPKKLRTNAPTFVCVSSDIRANNVCT